jgi:hypothetical protein
MTYRAPGFKALGVLFCGRATQTYFNPHSPDEALILARRAAIQI